MRWPPRPVAQEAMAVLCALLAGLMVAGVFALSWPTRGIVPQFYQREFAPAVMVACGVGYRVPARIHESPALSDFLGQKTRALDCESVRSLEVAEPNFFQQGQMYLIGSVGLLWKVTGVGWDRLAPLYAFLYGAYAVAIYGVFRLGVGRLLALAATMALLTSTFQLDNLPHLRDFGKAPFVLWTVLLLGIMAKHALSGRVLLGVAALAGGVLGVGIGFRMDLFMFIPPALLTILLVSPSGARPIARLGACVAFMASFVLAGWPILEAFRHGSSSFHVFLLGMTSEFDPVLGIQPSIYEWGWHYNDAYVSSILNSFATSLGMGDQLLIGTPEYESIARQYYLLLLTHFPADFAIRFLGSVIRNLELVNPRYLVYGMPGFLFNAFYLLADLMPWLALATAAALFAYRPLLGLFFGLMILYLAGVPMLQYQDRHVFHLQFIPFWIAIFMVRAASTFVVTAYRGDWSSAFGSGPGQHTSPRVLAIRTATFVGLAALLLGGSLGVLRLWQQSHLVEFLRTYPARATHPVALETSVDRKGDVLVQLPAASPPPSGGSGGALTTRYWVADFDGRRCGKDIIRFFLSYRASEPYYDASRAVDLDIRATTSYFFPTFETAPAGPGLDWGTRILGGLHFTDEEAACLVGIRQVGEIRDIPLLLSLRFAPGWEGDRLYQSLATERVRRVGRHAYQLYLDPRDLDVTRSQLRETVARIEGVAEDAVARRTPALLRFEGGLKMDARVEGVYSYVLQLKPVPVADEAYLVVEGEVIEGGLTVGLVKDDQWAGQVNITEAGRFIAVVRAGPGQYAVTIANNVPGHKTNHFAISKLGWVDQLGERREAAGTVR